MYASEPASSLPIGLPDLQLLARSESPDLADAILAFLDQEDPSPKATPTGALTLQGYKRQIDRSTLRYKTKEERRQLSREALQRLLTQPELAPPPRLHLAELLGEVYERGTPSGRAALLAVIKQAPLRLGLWGGLKRIYKLAEERLDAEIFGALVWRVDTEMARRSKREVGVGTLIYLRRRALRALKQVGTQLPILFPQLTVQVLRHYEPRTSFGSTWVAPRLWPGVYSYASSKKKPQDLLKGRLFDEAWKQSPDPLMLLLETCEGDAAAFFAIHSLRRDFPEVLRSVTPAWLARLARRPLASAHEFLIETLQGSPEFHQGKLRALGLHEAVLELLLSPSPRARTYAIEYARAHGHDLPDARLAYLLEEGAKDTQAFAATLLLAREPKVLGYAFLGRLLGYEPTRAFAEKSLGAFERPELPQDFLIDMLYGQSEQREWAEKYLKTKYQPSELGVEFWKRVLDDKRHLDEDEVVELALEALGKFPVATIGAGWLVEALLRGELNDTVSEWLARASALPGLDVERLKGLMLHVRYRRYAQPVLENSKLVKPRELGLPWLLALARRADEALHNFAHRYLLQHLGPSDFAEDGDAEAGTAKLFALATADKEPEPVRLFAQTYLRCHHPGISAEQPEAKALHLKPQLKRASYTAERIWPALFDARPDVRRFAVAITRAELRRWGYHTRVYELADSDAKEVRNIASDALLKAGDASAEPAHTLKVEELDAAQVFALTESRKRGTRELGLELIRRHYVRLGGVTRLSWLMESPDREVRLFAVRLLWERHRPRQLPPGWKPSGKAAVPSSEPAPAAGGEPTQGERFADLDSLRGFLRRILFGLPPGRSMEPRDDGTPRRHLPASVAKRHVIEIVRDLGEEDEAFARLCAPVLGEFTGSLARTEWQACLAALMRLQKAHPTLSLDGIPGGTQS